MLNALIPVFALILLGGFLKYLGFPGEGFWRGAERLTYYLLFPALLFLRLGTTVPVAIPLYEFVLLLSGLLLVVTIIIILAGYILKIRAAAFTSFYQGGIRFNTYVGLAVVSGLYGNSGLEIAALVVGILIPLINLLCITVFAFSVDGGSKSIGSIIKNIFTNPLIVACVLGIIWNNTGLELHGLLVSVLELLSSTALPLGLLSVGAGVHLYAMKDATTSFFVSSLIKLMLVPVIAFLLCQLTQQPAMISAVVVIFAALPTASSAYILARELGGDDRSMAAIITGQTLLAMVTMPLAIKLLTMG